MTTTGAHSPADVAVGASVRVVRLLRHTVRSVGGALEPVVRVAMRPPLVPDRWQPAHLLDSLGQEGVDSRIQLRDEAGRLLDELLPALLAEGLRRVSLTDLVLENVDLDRVVAGVDLDKVVDRVDLERVVSRVDVDGVAGRLDLGAVLDRLDLTDLVLENVDLDRVVAGVDLDKVVDRVDLERVVSRVDVDGVARQLDLDAVLDRLDLTAVVLQRVDLDRLVETVLSRIDLIALAEEVIDGVDLPEIVRESTGSMASDTVHGVRMQGIAADEAVARVVDRILLRRGRRPGRTTGSAVPAQDDRTP